MKCSVNGCNKHLRSDNTIGFCRKHRGRAKAGTKKQKIALRKSYKKRKLDRKEYRYILDKKYGITLEDKIQMYEAQDGICPICQKRFSEKKLYVDHNHQTGKVRDLLCNKCNTGIGMLDENIPTLKNAIEYIRRHNVTS